MNVYSPCLGDYFPSLISSGYYCAGEVGIEVIAAGNASVHEAALQSLAWKEKITTS